MWLDAGSVIPNDAPLREIRKILTQDGFVSTYRSGKGGKKGEFFLVCLQMINPQLFLELFSGSIAQWTHPQMFEYLGVQETDTGEGGILPLKDAPNLSGSLFGFNTDNSAVRRGRLAHLFRTCIQMHCFISLCARS